MTVAELIDSLGCYPADMIVVIDGYESGVEDITTSKIRDIAIIRDVNTEGYYGPHEEADDYQRERHPDAGPVCAVLITRNSR
jgi:hypothetical protein